MLVQQQLDQVALEGHGVFRSRSPDEFTRRDDAVIRYVHAEGVFAEAHDVLTGLAVETDEALELVGGLADELGSDAHINLTKDRWFTRLAR
ncbi:hypothetical protein D3C73_1290600 [compost metagenome]